ncbi:MAG TPA: hypothetical protein VH478_00265 [Trebonia sp.]|jgi:hypothetical protein|nr:hypothetical protein [Trebonia sp.]
MYVYNNQTPSARVTLFSGAGCTGAVVASLSQMDFFYGKAGVFRSVSLSH